MRNNKRIVVALAVAVFLAGMVVWLGRKALRYEPYGGKTAETSGRGEGSHSHQGHAPEAKPEDSIEYWTCSMHPQVRSDKPGQCPICGMGLVPVHTGDQGQITVDEHNREYLGIRSVPAERRHLVKKIRLPGKVSHDAELYRVQQEYLSVYGNLERYSDTVAEDISQRQEALLETAALRLRLLGFSDEQIAELEQRKAPDRSLIDPAAPQAWIQADVYEQDLPVVKAGQRVTAKIQGSDEEVVGQIYAIEDVVDPQTRSALARIQMGGGTHLRHGVFADVRLEIDLGHEHVSIPAASVIDTGTRTVVYVDAGDGRYELRQIQTGAEANGFVQVKEGVKEGERVVTDGNFLLDSQSTLTGGQSVLYSGSEEIKASSQQPVHRH